MSRQDDSSLFIKLVEYYVPSFCYLVKNLSVSNNASDAGQEFITCIINHSTDNPKPGVVLTFALKRSVSLETMLEDMIIPKESHVQNCPIVSSVNVTTSMGGSVTSLRRSYSREICDESQGTIALLKSGPFTNESRQNTPFDLTTIEFIVEVI